MNHSDVAHWPSKLKRTQPRLAVWNELHTQAYPVSARQIYDNLRKKGHAIDLSTIYRILERFTELSIVIQSKSTDTSTVLYGLNLHRHTHFTVCVQCHEKTPIKQCPLYQLSSPIDTGHFHVTGHHLEIFGYCPSCLSSKISTTNN